MDPSWLDFEFLGRPDFLARGPKLLIVKDFGPPDGKSGCPQTRNPTTLLGPLKEGIVSGRSPVSLSGCFGCVAFPSIEARRVPLQSSATTRACLKRSHLSQENAKERGRGGVRGQTSRGDPLRKTVFGPFL